MTHSHKDEYAVDVDKEEAQRFKGSMMKFSVEVSGLINITQEMMKIFVFDKPTES